MICYCRTNSLFLIRVNSSVPTLNNHQHEDTLLTCNAQQNQGLSPQHWNPMSMGGRDQCHRGCPLQCQVCKCRLTPAGKGSPMLTPAARGWQSNQVLEVVLPAAREVQCTPANSRGCLAARTLHALSSYWTYLTKYLCQYTLYMDGLQEPARSLSSRRRGWQTEEGPLSQAPMFLQFLQFWLWQRKCFKYVPITWTTDKDRETDKDKNTHMPILVAIQGGNSD